MNKSLLFAVAVCAGLLVMGSANISLAGCAHCGGHAVAQYDPGCNECVGGGAPCGHCHHCGCGILAVPVAAAKWVLRALGGGCACGGCDGEVYWGPFCNECDECDRCGNYRGGGHLRHYGGAIESSLPYGAMEGAPRAGCNCGQGSVSHMNPSTARHYATRPIPAGAYASRAATAGRIPSSAYASGRGQPTSYAGDPRYSAARRASSAPRYATAPQVVDGPTLAAPSSHTLPPGASPDMFQPRLISVTDRVVKPATTAREDVPQTAERPRTEVER